MTVQIFGVIMVLESIPCPIQSLTGRDCPGCGITRSTVALIDGRLLDAVDHNLITSIGSLLLLCSLLLWAIHPRFRRQIRRAVNDPSNRVLVLLGLLAVLFTFVRNTDTQFGQWLASGLYQR